jgi:hypothetical protein
MMLPSNQQSAKVSHPSKAALDFETLFVDFFVGNPRTPALFAPTRRSFLGWNANRFLAGMQTVSWLECKPFLGWNANFDAALLQRAPKLACGIATIRNQLAHTSFKLSRPALDAHRLQRGIGQSNFSGRGAFQQKAQRQALRIRDQHPFGAFAFLGRAYSTSPFWSERMNRPEMPVPIPTCLALRGPKAPLATTAPRLRLLPTTSSDATPLKPSPILWVGRTSGNRCVKQIKSRPAFAGRRLAGGLSHCGRTGKITCHCSSLNFLAALMPKSLNHSWTLLK